MILYEDYCKGIVRRLNERFPEVRDKWDPRCPNEFVGLMIKPVSNWLDYLVRNDIAHDKSVTHNYVPAGAVFQLMMGRGGNYWNYHVTFEEMFPELIVDPFDPNEAYERAMALVEPRSETRRKRYHDDY